MLIWLLVLADFAAGADASVFEADGAPTEGLLFRLTAAVVAVAAAATSVGVGVGVDSIAVTLDTRRCCWEMGRGVEGGEGETGKTGKTGKERVTGRLTTL
jgi:hypothetical protein